MRKTTLLLGLIMVGAALVLAACGGQTGDAHGRRARRHRGTGYAAACGAVRRGLPGLRPLRRHGRGVCALGRGRPGARCVRPLPQQRRLHRLPDQRPGRRRDRPGGSVHLRDLPQRPGHGPDLGHLPLRQGRRDLRGGRGALHDLPPGTRVQGERRQADHRLQRSPTSTRWLPR